MPILRYAGGFATMDAAAVAAHYGSVSAVTFTVAVNLLKDVGQLWHRLFGGDGSSGTRGV